jgi:hypothetical protein
LTSGEWTEFQIQGDDPGAAKLTTMSRPLYILGLTFQIPMIPPAQYLTLSLRGLGFDTFQTNLLTMPYTVFHSKWWLSAGTSPFQDWDSDLTPTTVITMLAISYLAEITGQLTLVAGASQIWALPFLIYLNAVDTSKVNRYVSNESCRCPL